MQGAAPGRQVQSDEPVVASRGETTTATLAAMAARRRTRAVGEAVERDRVAHGLGEGDRRHARRRHLLVERAAEVARLRVLEQQRRDQVARRPPAWSIAVKMATWAACA